MTRRTLTLALILACLTGAAARAQDAAAPAAANVIDASVGLVPRATRPGAGVHLSAGDSLGGGGAGAPAALDLLAYDAVNVAAPDLRGGADALARAAAATKSPLVSANVYRAGGTERLAKPYVIVQAFGKKLAVTGVTAPPAQPPAGVQVGDPVQSLRDVIPAMQKESDAIVVLAWGDRESAAAVLQAYPAVSLCLAGGSAVSDARPLRVGQSYLAQVPVAGEDDALGRAAVTFGGKGALAALTFQFVAAPDAAPQLARARAADDPLVRAVEAAPAGAAPAAPAERPVPTAADLAPEKALALGAETGNRAARVVVHSMTARARYGAAAAAPGRQLLVLNTEWENLIPLTLIYEKQVPTEYQIPNLADHLYLLVNGSRVARLRGDADALPGHVKVKEFKLERIGSRARGNVVFEVPAADVQSLELRFYDYAHGHFNVPLLSPAGGAAAQAKPLSAPLKNEVLEVAPFGVEKLNELAGRKAPAGMAFVSVDLRARSLFTVEADADAFDPKARKGAKTKVGHVADWKESRKYLQLVADGEYGYVPDPELTELEEEPRFLPDVMTGGRVVFLAPAEAKSLELRCDFPNARASTGAGTFRPKGMTLALEGKRPALPNAKPIVSVDDDVYKVAVVGQQAAAEFAGQKPADGKKFLVLDVTVNNTGKVGEFFQTRQQLKHADEAGGQSELSPATFQGVRRPAELVWIPPGERRSFQAVFEVPAAETRPRLAFTGVSRADVLNLQPLGAAGAPGAVATADAPAKMPAKQPNNQVAANTNVPPANNTTPAKAPSQPAVKTPPAQKPPAQKPPAKPKPEEKPTRVAAKQPHEPKGLPGVGLTPEQVNTAIDKGAEALWAHTAKELEEQKREFGHRLGEHALVALALVHAEYHKKNPQFDAALRQFLETVHPPDLGTYGAGCLAMTIEGYGDGMYLPQLRSNVRALLENQYANGTWGYYTNVDAKLLVDPNADRVLQVRGGIPLEGPGAAGEPMTRISKPNAESTGDNSTSQYALLGLWSAARATVPVDRGVWAKALAAYRENQSDDGGWGYHGKSSYGYGSMTCAGVCSIAIARHQLGEKNPADDEAIERGLAWLANNFAVDKHPLGSIQHLFYYLYSLERVGRILDTEFIGPHEWYPLGARWLVDNQKADGLWGGGNYEDEHIATPMALLFLTRATQSLEVVHKRGGEGTLRTDVAAAPGHRVYIILDSSGTMMEEIDGVQRHKVSRDAMADLVAEMPETTQLALRAFGHRKAANQQGANEDTELLVPLGKLQREEVVAALTKLRARGKTPLSLTLQQVAQDVKSSASAERPTTVVFVTDGGEDNTRPAKPPLAAAQELAGLPGVSLYVVGFDIQRPEWVDQLRKLAAAGGGNYLAADDPQSLLPGLRAAVYRTPEAFILTDAKGHPVRKAKFKQSLKLPEGQYSIVTDFGGKRYAQPLWINTDSTTAVVFDASKIGVDTSGTDVPAGRAAPAATARDAAPQQRPAQQRPAQQRPAQPNTRPGQTAPAPAAGARKFCTECGTALAAGAKFCTKCGAKVGG